MDFSLIGTGFIMPRHADAIHHVGGRILDIVNASKGKDEWRDRIRAPGVDAVVIMTPNDLHVPMALEAAELGKIVLCEKPLGLTTASIRTLEPHRNVYSVLQLRHHPMALELMEEAARGGDFDVRMEIAVYRDPFYFRTWKGEAARSGGILFNIGVHYFDLLKVVFGAPDEVRTTVLRDDLCSGVLSGPNWRCDWTVSILGERSGQRRLFRVNGRDRNFSSKDNLSHENLHRRVYEDMLSGRGVGPAEAAASVELIERIYEAAHRHPDRRPK